MIGTSSCRFAAIKKALSRFALAALILGPCVSSADTVLVTGANSGIGLEFARQYAAANWTVIATHRHEETPEVLKELAASHPRVRVERMDVTDQGQVAALANRLAGAPIDVLINNAGVYAETNGDASTQNFGNFDFALMDTILAVNVKGPLIVSQTFYPNVRSSRQKKIIAIGSTTGSLTQPYPGTNGVFYRASKAALNKEMQLVAEIARPDGVTVLVIHPGVVRTERLTEFTKKLGVDLVRDPDALTPVVSVSRMIQTIARATVRDSGRFLRYDGMQLAW